MKYKVGDVVKVRSDLNTIKGVVAGMLKFKGKIVHIQEVFEEDVKKHFEKYMKDFKDYDIKVEVKKKEPILDEKEKKYLSAVIRPFRDRVKNIMKRFSGNYEYICIFLKHIEKDFNEDICLPYFKSYTMYKGMIPDKKYTLEELGL